MRTISNQLAHIIVILLPFPVLEPGTLSTVFLIHLISFAARSDGPAGSHDDCGQVRLVRTRQGGRTIAFGRNGVVQGEALRLGGDW